MARYARGIMLVMCMLLSSLPRATIAETEEEINQLFLRARSFEDNKDHLLAMRTYRTALRLAPGDIRIRKRLVALHRSVVATVPVRFEGKLFQLPIFEQPNQVVMPDDKMSANALVTAYFKWKRIPLFRSDSDKCAKHTATENAELMSIMGQTCVSSLFVEAHNAVQSVLRGNALLSGGVAEIPTTSRVSCGPPCGVIVPPRSPAPADDAVLQAGERHGEDRVVVWSGRVPLHESGGADRLVAVTLFSSETRDSSLRRAAEAAGAPTQGPAWEAARSALRDAVVRNLSEQRRAALHALAPFAARSQALGDETRPPPTFACRAAGDGDGCTRVEQGAPGDAPMPVLTSAEGGGSERSWDVAANEVRPAEIDEDAAAAQRYIWERQHPAECSNQTALVYGHDRAYWGFAANVHFMTVALNMALATGRVFLTRSPDHWNYGGEECRHGWACYFLPVSSCSEQDVWEPYTLPLRADFRWDHRGYLYRVDTLGARTVHYANVDGPWQESIGNTLHPDTHEPMRKWIPAAFRHRGLLWWRAQLTRFLLRPKRFVRAFIAERAEALGMPPHAAPSTRIAALHVRRGDKAYDQYQGCFFGSIDSYIAQAHKLAPGGLDAIYVSTDDPSVVDALPRTAVAHALRTLHDPLEQRYNGTHIYAPPGVSLARWPAFPGNDPNVDTLLYALETIKSVWFLAFHAPVFVGTVTSSMSRLVYQLRVAFGEKEGNHAWSVDKDARHAPGWFADP